MNTHITQKMALAAGVLAMLSISAQAQTTVYSANFDANPTLGGGATVAGAGVTAGFSGAGALVSTNGGVGSMPAPFSGNMLQNNTGGTPFGTAGTETVLTINNLPAHDHINLSFLLACLDSWDGNDLTYGPDFFNVSVDGTTLFSETFDNARPTFGSSSNQTFTGGSLGSAGDRGYGNNFFDSGYSLAGVPSLTNIVHSASSVTIRFFANGAGWEGGTNESFAIDNLTVETSITRTGGGPAPEPGTIALALVGIPALLRRRKKS